MKQLRTNKAIAQVALVLLGTAVLFLLALAGVWTAGRLSSGYILDLGPQEWGRIQNANDWEQHGSFSYRWTRGETLFRLPVLGTPRCLIIRLDGSRPAGVDPAEVTLWLNGRPAVSFLPPAGPYLYQVVYDGSTAGRWETVVEVRTEPFRTADDPRELGAIVDWLHFSPPLDLPAPSWPLVVLWTAVGLAALALGRTLGWPQHWALILAVFLEVLLSVLLAWGLPVALPWAGLLLAVLLAGAVAAWAGRRRAPAQTYAGTTQAAAREDGGQSREPSPRASDDGRPGPFALLCLVLALAVAALPLLTKWLPGGSSWGLHMLDPFYPATGPLPRVLVPLLPLLGVAVAALPSLNRDLRLLGRRAWEAGRRLTSRVGPAGRWLLLGLLFVPLFYMLRARVLWGDGPSLIGRISAGYRFNEPEMIPFFVQGTLYQWAERLWGWSVADTYTLTSLVLGALYVAMAAALSAVLGRDRFERALIFGLLATLATLQFGFGYLENYAYIAVALLALFWQMVRCLRGQGSPALVMALWVLAGACHLQALLVGPAVLYTVIRAWRMAPAGSARRRQVLLTLAAAVIPAAALLGLFIAGGYNVAHLFRGAWTRGNNPYMLVPLRSSDTYTLFSLRHLANLVNEHVLVAPVALPLLLLVALRYRRQVPWRDAVVVALILSAAGLLLFASTLYPDLGAPMDWDLFAPAALPYTLLAGLLFARAVPAGGGKRYAATVLLVSAGAHTAMWVLLNAQML